MGRPTRIRDVRGDRGRRRPAPVLEDSTIETGPTVRPREALTPRSTLALQRQAGNSAVSTLLELDVTATPTSGDRGRVERRPRVQRDTPDPPVKPPDYTKQGGVQVDKTGMTRVQVTGLTYGVKGGHQATYRHPRGTTFSSSEKSMTTQSPDNMAVVIRPDTLDASRPTQVILHFHGWGFRDIDPYAGYAVATGQNARQGATGTVRDVDQEHWAQQIGAVSKERAADPAKSTAAGPQIVAVLAQGRGMSDFGNVPTFDYVKDVFDKAGGTLAKITTYHVILSAHSGGGDKQIAKKVNAGDAVGTDPSRLRPPAAGQAPQQASDLVILFDAEGSASTMDVDRG